MFLNRFSCSVLVSWFPSVCMCMCMCSVCICGIMYHGTPPPLPPPSFEEYFEVLHCFSFLKLYVFGWLQSSSSCEVAVFNKVGIPKIPLTPPLSSPW